MALNSGSTPYHHWALGQPCEPITNQQEMTEDFTWRITLKRTSGFIFTNKHLVWKAPKHLPGRIWHSVRAHNPAPAHTFYQSPQTCLLNVSGKITEESSECSNLSNVFSFNNLKFCQLWEQLQQSFLFILKKEYVTLPWVTLINKKKGLRKFL